MDAEVQDAPETASPLVIDHGERVSETPAVDDGLSELERHKRERGYTTPPEAPKEPEPPPLPEAATPPETPEKTEPKKPERWKDPETGDTYDMRHRVARRVKTLLEDRGKTRAEVDQLRKERDELMRALMGRKEPEKADPAPPTDDEPNPDDATKYPEGQFDKAFIRDMARWSARQETKQVSESIRTERMSERRQQAEAAAIRQWQDTLPEARKKYADFDDVLARIPNTPENAPIARLMMGSPVGNDVVYVLGSQPEAMEAYRRAPSDEHRLRLLYHLEAQIIAAHRGAPPAKTETTRAPQPTTPVHTGAGAASPIDWSRTDDPDQYQRWKAQRRATR